MSQYNIHIRSPPDNTDDKIIPKRRSHATQPSCICLYQTPQDCYQVGRLTGIDDSYRMVNPNTFHI